MPARAPSCNAMVGKKSPIFLNIQMCRNNLELKTMITMIVMKKKKKTTSPILLLLSTQPGLKRRSKNEQLQKGRRFFYVGKNWLFISLQLDQQCHNSSSQPCTFVTIIATIQNLNLLLLCSFFAKVQWSEFVRF